MMWCTGRRERGKRFWVGSVVPIQNIHFRETGLKSGDGWRGRRPHQPFPLSLSCGPLCHSHYLPIIFTLLILNSLQNIFLLVVNCSAGDCAHTASAYSVLRSTSGSACGQLLYTSAFWSKYLHHKSLEISFWVCCKKKMIIVHDRLCSWQALLSAERKDQRKGFLVWSLNTKVIIIVSI